MKTKLDFDGESLTLEYPNEQLRDYTIASQAINRMHSRAQMAQHGAKKLDDKVEMESLTKVLERMTIDLAKQYHRLEDSDTFANN